MKVTRFAPSPTGNLHIGGVRTALFNYVFSKQSGGLFLIRVEDTDRERSKKEYEEDIISGLEWLGISPDKTPIRQSERSDMYQKAADKLIDSGNAYWCDCSPEDLEEMREQQAAAGKKPMYDGRSRNLGLERSDKTVLRLATPLEGETVVNDLIRGEITFNNSELDDLILLRSDGTPTYHFCNVVDDFDQGVTTVIRGEDHISNTPRQIHIQKALGYPDLEYAHLPLVLGEDKKRLSKRHAATSLNAYKEMGFTKETIINALALLGWSTENEIFSIDELIESFKLENVQKAAAVFDLKRFNVRVSLVSPGFIKTPMTDKNDFPMPMIKSPEFAADQMFKGLTKNKGFEIHFPKSFTSIMKFLKIMPNGLYFKIIEKGMKKIVD